MWTQENSYCECDWTLEQVEREIVESPSVEIFKTWLDMVQGNLF